MKNLKEKILKQIKEIKRSHTEWYAHAEAIISGHRTLIKIPRSYTDCKVGKWLYGEGYFLSYCETFKEIEEIHIRTHEIYLSIYKQNIVKKNFFKRKALVKATSKTELTELKGFSDLLIEKFDHLAKMIEKENPNKLKSEYEKFQS